MATDYQEYRPRKWSDFVSDSWQIDYIKHRIAKGDWEDAGAFAIHGPSGCGKTTLAHLIARATLCPFREEGTWDNCGECDVCCGKPHPAIIDYTVKDATEVKESFKEIQDRLQGRPLFPESRKDRVRWWVIINEFQLVSRERAASLLNDLENCKPHATWILVSMEPERLPTQVKEAIEGRCKRILLSEPSESDVIKALTKHPKVTDSVARALVKYVRGNYRKAWSELGMLLVDRETLTEKDVHQSLGGGANPLSRQQFWTAIESGNYLEAINIRSKWKVDDETLYHLLLEDIVYSNALNPEVIKGMAIWKATGKKPDLVMGCLLQFVNKSMPSPALAEALKAQTFKDLMRL